MRDSNRSEIATLPLESAIILGAESVKILKDAEGDGFLGMAQTV